MYTDTYDNYTVSVDQIEEWTGFDYFCNLPEAIETAAETNTSWQNFKKF
jgi:DNA/RNA endonuclease G (NUC1)